MINLPLLVLEIIAQFLSVIDILSIRSVNKVLYSICESTHFNKPTYFNTVVLFRRLFKIENDVFHNHDTFKSHLNFYLFGKFSVNLSYTSTQCWLSNDTMFLSISNDYFISSTLISSCSAFSVGNSCNFNNVSSFVFGAQRGCLVNLILGPNGNIKMSLMNNIHSGLEQLIMLTHNKLPKYIIDNDSTIIGYEENDCYFVLQSCFVHQFNSSGNLCQRWVIHDNDVRFNLKKLFLAKKSDTPFIIDENTWKIFIFALSGTLTPAIIRIKVKSYNHVKQVKHFFECGRVFFNVITVISSDSYDRHVFSYEFRTKSIYFHFFLNSTYSPIIVDFASYYLNGKLYHYDFFNALLLIDTNLLFDVTEMKSNEISSHSLLA